MYEQLKSLEQRLRHASGEMWLESGDYWLANYKKPDFDRAHYNELVEREEILSAAATQVQTALEVIEAVA